MLRRRKSFSLVVEMACLSLALCVMAKSDQEVASSTPQQFVSRQDVESGMLGMKDFSKLMDVFRRIHESYPKDSTELVLDVLDKHKDYGFQDTSTAQRSLFSGLKEPSPDSISASLNRDRSFPFIVLNTRPDLTQVGSIRTTATKDLVAYSLSYVVLKVVAHKGNTLPLLSGYYIVLWHDGGVESISPDLAYLSPQSKGFVDSFPLQSGVPFNALTFEEYNTQLGRLRRLPIVSKPLNAQKQLVLDNGGPESLVIFSRLLDFPNRNGIAREDLWRTFSPSQETFALKQVREGATKLKLPLQSKKLTLAQLAALRSSAILQMRGDLIAQNPLNPRPSAALTAATSTTPQITSTNRIVTLAQSGIEYSIVQDAGMTRVVRNVELAKLYSGEALLPQAANAPSALKIDNPVRVVPFQTKSDEVVQVVTLTNQGKTPLTLEIERPLPGVTKAELSSKTLAAGASATLTLNIKWREVLPGDVQQVFVTLKTSDPIQPRAMLGFRLEVPPAPPLNASPDSGAKPPVLP